MIKNYFKYIILIFTFSFPMVVGASSGLDYQDTIRYVNNYIYQYHKYNNYIYIDDRIGYNYENGEIKYNSDFKSGGLLSKTEYEITNKNNNTFLSNGLEYWTLTRSSANRHYVVNYRIQEKNDNEETGVRLTEYVKNNIGVTGTGSYANPWVFSELRNLHINSINLAMGKVSTTECTDGAKKESVTLTYTKDLGANFSLCPEDGYLVYSNSCSEYTSFQGNNKYYISSVPRDDMICNIDYTYITEKVNLVGCSNGIINPAPAVIYANKVHKKWFIDDDARQPQISKINTVPTKKGYTYQGHYINSTEIIDKNGNLNKNAASLMYDNISLSATCTPNTYHFTLSISNATSSNHTASGSVVYDSHLPAITIPKREYTVMYDYNGGLGSISSDVASHTFDGYYYGNKQYYNGSGGSARIWDIDSDVTLTGKWSGGTVNLPSAARNGYRFEGWYNGNTRVTNTTVITRDVTLKAKWTDIEPPKCVLVASASGVSFESITDNVAVTKYGITTSSTASYNSNSKQSLSINTFYGHVKDAAGNTGNCRISIGGTYADTYDKTTRTCNRKFVNYTKKYKTCNKSTKYEVHSEVCNASRKYTQTTYQCKGSYKKVCTKAAFMQNCNSLYHNRSDCATDSNCTWKGTRQCTGYTPTCSTGTLVGDTCKYVTSGTCPSGFSHTSNQFSSAYWSYKSSVTVEGSCVETGGSCSYSWQVGSTKTSCSAASYDYYFDPVVTVDTSSCSVSSFVCNGSNVGKSKVTKCVDLSTYYWGRENATTVNSCVNNKISCVKNTNGHTYVSCSPNYEYWWSDSETSTSSCSEESAFSCEGGNQDKSYVSDCTPTSYSCNGDGYTKINNSFCYKY